MKILTLHCDYIRYQALKKAVKDAEEFKQAYEDAIIETSLSVDFRGQMREMFVKHFLDKAEQKVKA